MQHNEKWSNEFKAQGAASLLAQKENRDIISTGAVGLGKKLLQVFNVYKIYKRFKLLWDADSKSPCQNCCLFLNETYKCYLKPIPAGGTFCSTSDCYQGKLPCGRVKDRKNIPFSNS